MQWRRLTNGKSERISAYRSDDGRTVELDREGGEWHVFEPNRPDRSWANQFSPAEVPSGQTS